MVPTRLSVKDYKSHAQASLHPLKQLLKSLFLDYITPNKHRRQEQFFIPQISYRPLGVCASEG